MRARLAIVGVMCVAVGLSPRQAAQARPNVLLVTLDTTRADRMGFLGSTRGLTPALDAFARDALVFTNAFAQAPITTVSHATILTGTYPPFHRVTDFGRPLAPSVPYLPDLLRHEGYKTAAFVAALVLDPHTGTAPGFDRGFDRYDAGFRIRRPGEDRYQTVERRGDEVVARAIAWVGAAGTGPWFAWVHLYDPHDPYDPPRDLKERFAKAPYDGEIAGVDRLVGRLLASAPGALVVVAADHGEALGEHGEDTHGVFLYDEVLHVPLVMRLPDRRLAGARIDERVRLADVAPTVLEAAGLSKPAAMQGESLLPLVRPRSDRASGRGPGSAPSSAAVGDQRPVYAETDYPRQAFGWAPLTAWRADRFLLVRAPRPELYDVIADPGATRDLAASRGRIVEGMLAELDRFTRQVTGSAASTSRPAVDPDLARRLAALGYVSGSGAGAAAGSGIDAKDRIAIANTLRTAVVAVEDAAFAKAIPLLERVVASEPGIPIAQLQLGAAYARLRQYARAVPTLKRAVTLQPENMFAHYELAVGLYETGNLAQAAGEFELVASRMPQWADARYSLASVYARIDRVPQAQSELRAALALEPKHFRANLLLGRILTLLNQPAEAVPLLQTAVGADPASREAHEFLADAYEKGGNAEQAAKERQKAKTLKQP